MASDFNLPPRRRYRDDSFLGRRLVVNFTLYFILVGVLFGAMSLLSACPVIRFFSAQGIYEIKGQIRNSLDHKSIASVKVVASCEKSRLDHPRQTFSDNDGRFIFKGTISGPMDDCELSFEHASFKRKTVKLPQDSDFSKFWRIDIELEPL